MVLRKSFPLTPARLCIVFCGLALLLGAEALVAQIRTVLVSPVPGNPVASGGALLNALAGIPSPSATDRWLLKIEPGIYDVGSTPLAMRPWVDIEGAGIGVTTIRGSRPWPPATVQGADNAELRLLTVEADDSSAPNVIAMANVNASPRLYRVKLSSVGNTVWGMRNVNSAPRIEECEITVASTSGTVADTYGLVFSGSPATGGRSSILRSKISVSGGKGDNYGIFLSGALAVTEIRDSQIDAIAVGGATTRGLFGYGNAGWSGQESLRLRNTEIHASGGSSAAYGIDIQSSAWVGLEVNESTMQGDGAPVAYGINSAGPAAMTLQGASVFGSTHTIHTAGNALVASTLLNGGPVLAGSVSCVGVWDENAVFYPQMCP
jgi:hypothetical protein